jgi:ABC-type dipeptide/oligopeptide/nickel transport system permease subunit
MAVAKTSSVAKLKNEQPETGWRKEAGMFLYQVRRSPLMISGFVIVVFWVVVSLIAPLLATIDPLQQDVVARLNGPGFAKIITTENDTEAEFRHLLGTDELGRDIYSRVVYGGRITIPAGLAVIILGSIVGTFIGALSGYVGGIYDDILMRLTELFLAFPTIILALAVTAALGPDLQNAVIALVVVWWPTYARVIRSLVLELKNQEFVEAARSVGATGPYILTRTILPNAVAPAIILATLDIGNAILTFAGLSFLGLGAEPSIPEWGRMVAIGVDFFDQWWMWLFPGLAIASLVMAFNFIGDGLRDITDPRTRKQ